MKFKRHLLNSLETSMGTKKKKMKKVFGEDFG